MDYKLGFVGATFACCFVFLLSLWYSKQIQTSQTSLFSHDENRPFWQSIITLPGHSGGKGLSCRHDAIQGILAEMKNSSGYAIEEAKKCWAESLAFFLSYPLNFGFGSHVVPFLASAWATDGAILEMGSGWYSTPVAHRISVLQGRNVLTADTKYGWLKYFVLFSSPMHHLYYVNVKEERTENVSNVVHVVSSWDAIGGQREKWGLIFVDHAPGERRKVDLKRLRRKADLLVIHDTEPRAERAYKSQTLLATFKHRTTFGPGWSSAYTDVLSDTRPELVYIVKVLNEWSMELLKSLKQ